MKRQSLPAVLPPTLLGTLCLIPLLGACDSGGGVSSLPDTQEVSRSGTAPLPGASGGESVNGLWDFSTLSGTVYQYWTDAGIVTIHEYQGDAEEGSGENCYHVQDLVYEVDGNVFSFLGGDFTVTRQGSSLNLDSSFGTFVAPLASGVDRANLNACLH